MNQIEERLAEAVRKYEHLYDTSSKGHNDAKMANNSWKEIATNVGLSVPDCIKKWRSLRDKFVRIRRKMTSSSGDAGGHKKVLALNTSLSWLGPHIKHRETSSNYDVKELTSEGRDNGGPLELLSPSVSPIDDRQSPNSSSPLESRSSSPAPSNSSTSVTSTQLTTLPPASTPPVSMSPQLPTFLSPVSKTEPSPLSRTGRKRQREQQEDDNFTQKLDQLEESMLLMHRRLERPEDEISRFGQTICDMLRKVPEDDQGDAMQAVYNLLYGFRKRPCILKMNQIEERIAEEVRNYEHLYDTSLRGYKDAQKANNSWKEIAENVGLSVPECIKRWRSLRDKYVRIQRKMTTSSGDAGGQHKVPALSFLSWLGPHIKHRETSSNYDVKDHTSQGRDNGGPLELLSPIDDSLSSPSSSPLESRSSSPAPSNSSMSTQLSTFPSPRQCHLLSPAWDGKGKGSSRTTEILLKKLDKLEKSRLLIQRRLERPEHDIKIQTDGV
ncbi:unnamed protein product [Arctogadus glacialis]